MDRITCPAKPSTDAEVEVEVEVGQKEFAWS